MSGYREVIRLDHLAPNGCAGNNCYESIYARQSACGGAITYLQRDRWETSRLYQLDGENGATSTSFDLMSYDGNLYTKLKAFPDPAHPASFKEAWCTSIDSLDKPMAASFELKIELDVRGSQPTASVYWQQPLKNAERPGEYDLKFEDKIHLLRASSARGLRYTGDGFDLSVTGAPDADSKTVGILKLRLSSVNASSPSLISLPVVCVLQPIAP